MAVRTRTEFQTQQNTALATNGAGAITAAVLRDQITDLADSARFAEDIATPTIPGLMSAADKTKLNGVATGATVNAADAALRDRATHTGTQTAATISDFTASSRAQVEATLVAGLNVTITPSGSGATRQLTIAAAGGGGGSLTDGDKGDITVTAAGATWTIDPGAVTLSKIADLANSTILGRVTAGTGVTEALTPAQVRTLLNVANGATANAADATLLARANHTGTQLASTISDFATAVAATAAVTANTAKVTNATHTGEVTGATVLTITNDAVTNAKLANMAINTIKGAVSAGDPVDLTPVQVRTMLNVADGATANSPNATLLARANHTGTQTASTISDFTAAADARITASNRVASDITGVAGAIQITNHIALTQAQYDAIAVKNANTKYEIVP